MGRIPCYNFKVLVPYRDGEISDEEAREVEAHLASCERCRERLQWLDFKGVKGLVGPLKTAPSSPCLSAEVAAAYLDSALKKDEQKAVEHHAAECEACLEAMGLLEAVAEPPSETPAPTAEALQRFFDLFPSDGLRPSSPETAPEPAPSVPSETPPAKDPPPEPLNP